MATNTANSIIVITFSSKISVIFRKNYFSFVSALFYFIPEKILINPFFGNRHFISSRFKLFNILLVCCSAFSLAKIFFFFFIHCRNKRLISVRSVSKNMLRNLTEKNLMTDILLESGKYMKCRENIFSHANSSGFLGVFLCSRYRFVGKITIF